MGYLWKKGIQYIHLVIPVPIKLMMVYEAVFHEVTMNLYNDNNLNRVRWIVTCDLLIVIFILSYIMYKHMCFIKYKQLYAFSKAKYIRVERTL